MDNLGFFQIQKADSQERLVYLTASSEAKDQSNQIMDYEGSKPFFQKWSEGFAEVTNGKSFGNVRLQHNVLTPIGKIVEPLGFDDVTKTITAVVKVVDDAAWNFVEEGVLAGASIGGRAVKRWYDAISKAQRYIVDPYELSLVDKPCNPDSRFLLVKADGSEELCSFNTRVKENEIMENNDVIKVALAGEIQKAFNGTDYEKRENLRGALYNKITVPIKLANSDGSIYLYIRDVYNDKVVFEGNLNGDNNEDTYQIGYTISDEGIVTFTTDPVQVRTEYVVAEQKSYAAIADGNIVTKADEEPKTDEVAKADEVKTEEDPKTDEEPKTDEVAKVDEVAKADEATTEEVIAKVDTEEVVEEVAKVEETTAVEEVAKVDEVLKADDATEEVAKVEETEIKTEEPADVVKTDVVEEVAKVDEIAKADSSIEDVINMITAENFGDIVQKVGARISTSNMAELQKVSHIISEMGGACTCEKCSSLFKTDDEIAKADGIKVTEKFDALQKAIDDLSTQNEDLVLKVAALSEAPDDTDAPSNFVVSEKVMVVAGNTEDKVEKADTGATLTPLQASQKNLANVWENIKANPVAIIQ